MIRLPLWPVTRPLCVALVCGAAVLCLPTAGFSWPLGDLEDPRPRGYRGDLDVFSIGIPSFSGVLDDDGPGVSVWAAHQSDELAMLAAALRDDVRPDLRRDQARARSSRRDEATIFATRRRLIFATRRGLIFATRRGPIFATRRRPIWRLMGTGPLWAVDVAGVTTDPICLTVQASRRAPRAVWLVSPLPRPGSRTEHADLVRCRTRYCRDVAATTVRRANH